MSSIEHNVTKMSRAEAKFREAFERLKTKKTQVMPVGSKVSQNTVAKEAGVLPSALRSSRFPNLCHEIAEWVEEHKDDPSQKSGRQKILAERNARRADRERLQEMKIQRDLALSKLLSAERHILELTMEVRRLHALIPHSVSPLQPADRYKEEAKSPGGGGT